ATIRLTKFDEVFVGEDAKVFPSRLGSLAVGKRGRPLAAIRIVQAEDRPLLERATRAHRIGMVWVPVHLDGTAVVALDLEWRAHSTQLHRGVKVARHAGYHALRSPGHRHQLVFFPTTTCSASQRERRGHQLHETT